MARRIRSGQSNPAIVRIPKPGIDRITDWFAARGWTPWTFQRDTWSAFQRGESGLIQVPTGAGKTYAAYLGPLGELLEAEVAGTADHLSIVYVTPLRAVARDIELALQAPIDALGSSLIVESRTGDTRQSVRARQRKRLPHVLITTPESLTLLLTRQDAPLALGRISALILDEWHELLSSKRGSQVELASARLRAWSPLMRTWALSATLANLPEAAACAVGTTITNPRIIQGDMSRVVNVSTVLPEEGNLLPWVGHMGLSMLPALLKVLDPAVPTIVFTNTRSQAERWFSALAAARPLWADSMALHHGSLDRAERERVESGLKGGTLGIVVATSSLDLGIDFAPVERVVQIGSMKGIARIMQRAGRAAHRPNAPTHIFCVPTYAMELIEVVAAKEALLRGEIEARTPCDRPLDVLAQHLVTCGLGGGFRKDDLLVELRTAWSYRNLTEAELDWTLELVTHGGSSLRAYPEFHKLSYQEGTYQVVNPRIAQLHRMNIGTITADATVDIRYVRGRSLGRIEEHFIAHLREGERFTFAGKTLAFAYLRDLVAFVRPAKGTTTFTPIWSGTRLPISESLSTAVRRVIASLNHNEADSPELLAFSPLAKIQSRMSLLPEVHQVLVEICNTREGRHCCLFPFEGRLVNAGVGALIALRLSRHKPATFSITANDYGVEILCTEDFPFESLLSNQLFTSERLLEDSIEGTNISELARSQFREIARVSGLVLQSYPGNKKSGRQLNAGTTLLYDVLVEFDPGNLLIHQARREVLDRHFESSRLGRTFERLQSSTLTVRNTAGPTPLSFPIMIERLSTKLSSETIQDRIARMKAQWTPSSQSPTT